MTATKKPFVANPNAEITDFQVKRIMANCKYQDNIKTEWVQWVTGDVKRTSLKSITQAQASQIIRAQEGSTLVSEPKAENWGKFDVSNTQHRYVMSVLRTADIVVNHEKYGEVADMHGWLSNFLQFDNRCPVKKPLLKMETEELSKIIYALEKILDHKLSKK